MNSASDDRIGLDPPGSGAGDAYGRTLLGAVDRRYLSTRGGRTFLAAALGLALIIPSVQFVHTIRKVDKSLWRAGGQRHRTALGRWLPTAGLLTEGPGAENPYGFGHWFPTPPMVLISLAPLWKIGYVPAGIVWALLKIAGIVGGLWLVITALRRDGLVLPLGVVAIAGAWSIRPIVSDIQHGNLNVFMMVWLAIAWASFVRGRDVWAGIFVAAAIVTKITPALALVYFAYKRRWRVCLGAAVGLVLLVAIVPGALIGFGRNVEWLRAWFDMLVRPFALEGYASLEIGNQSLYGVLLRLLSNAGVLSIEHMPGAQAADAGMEMMARPATAAGRLLRPAVSIVVVASLAVICRCRAPRRADLRYLLEFGMVLIAMLLLSERTWKHHATTLPLVYLGAWYAVACIDRPQRIRGLHVAALVLQFVALLLLSEGLLGDRLGDRVLDGGFFCWGLVLCFVQLGVLLRDPRLRDGDETWRDAARAAGRDRSRSAAVPG